MNSYMPDTLYCSFNKFNSFNNIDDTLLVGYLTPDGSNFAAKQRKNRVLSYGNKKYKPLTFVNEPLHGFKFHSFKYSTSGDGSAWITDPRGFVTLVKLDNFNELLKYTTIRNGEILKECIWVRDGRYNKLITIDSEQYKESKKLTEGLRRKYKLKDLTVNDIITLSDNVIGRYLGTFNLVRLHNELKSTVDIGQHINEVTNIVKASIDKSRYRCILVTVDGKDTVLLYKTFTIISIEKTPNKIKLLDNYEDWLNISLTSNSVEFKFTKYGSYANAIIGFTSKKPKTINYTMSLEEYSDNNIIFYKWYRYTDIITIFTKYDGKYYSLRRHYGPSPNGVIGTIVVMILSSNELYSELTYENTIGYYNRYEKKLKTNKNFISSNITLYSAVISWDNVITKKTYKRVCI